MRRPRIRRTEVRCPNAECGGRVPVGFAVMAYLRLSNRPDAEPLMAVACPECGTEAWATAGDLRRAA